MNIPLLLIQSLRLRSKLRLSPVDKQKLQTRKLNLLLKHVFEYSRFYRSHYERHGIFARHVGKVGLSDLPPVDKQMLLQNFDDAVCDPALKIKEIQKFILDPANRERTYPGGYSVVHTSGTTGTPGIFVYGPREINLMAAVMFTRVNCVRIKARRTRLMITAAIEGKYAGVAICDHTPRFAYELKKCSVNLPKSEISRVAQNFQPDVLAGYASAIQMLAQDQLNGRINLKPESIVCSGEPMTELARRDITQAFGIRPASLYAASESIVMGVECRSHGNMHLFDDLHVFESIDQDLRAVSEGEVGELLLTSLYNYTLPIIRYRTSDRLGLNQSHCPCGSTFPLVTSLAGRTEEYLWFDAGRAQKEFIHPITFAELFAPGLERFRIIQTSPRDFKVQAQALRQRQTVAAELSRQLDGVLASKGLTNTVNYSFDFVEQIPNLSASGKFDLIIPMSKSAVPETTIN
jgi:phenylacetate-coenzyme A ligase PaaK-like adenylate-forming protein